MNVAMGTHQILINIRLAIAPTAAMAVALMNEIFWGLRFLALNMP
jgi:hypothetical protein